MKISLNYPKIRHALELIYFSSHFQRPLVITGNFTRTRNHKFQIFQSQKKPTTQVVSFVPLTLRWPGSSRCWGRDVLVKLQSPEGGFVFVGSLTAAKAGLHQNPILKLAKLCWAWGLSRKAFLAVWVVNFYENARLQEILWAENILLDLPSRLLALLFHLNMTTKAGSTNQVS